MPQLNPEFFVSQLFWLVVTFSFLFIFLWRISLPRIGNVLEKRERKISENLTAAKELQIEAEKIQATELGKDVLEANENWDEQSVTYQEAKEEFRTFIATAEQFVTTVTEPGPPNEYANLVTSHEELKTLVNLVYEDTVELLAGLESSDTGEQRAAALDSFNSNLDQFIKKIEEVVASATSS